MIQKRMILLVLSAALVICGVFSTLSIGRVQSCATIINAAGLVRCQVQKLVKEELYGVHNDAIIAQVNELLVSLKQGGGDRELLYVEDEQFQYIVGQMQSLWPQVKEEIAQVRAGGDGQRLFFLSETYFLIADQAVDALETYTDKMAQQAQISIVLLIAAFLLAGGLVLYYHAQQEKRQAQLKQVEEQQRKKEQMANLAEAICAPVNNVSELVYITDIETREILFMNEAAKQGLKVGNEFRGQKCYQAVHGLDGPCPFCNNEDLRPGEILSQERTNQKNGVHYLIESRLIQWEGRKARLELACDLTEAQRQKRELELALGEEKMLMACVRTLYQNLSYQESLSSILSYLGTFLSAQRVYVVEEEEGIAQVKTIWQAEGLATGNEFPDGLPFCQLKESFLRMQKEELMVIQHMDAVGEPSSADDEVLRSHQITNFVAVSLDETRTGFLCVENPATERMKNIDPLFQTLRYFIMLARQRYEGHQRLLHLSYRDALSGFYNRNRYMQDLERRRQQQKPVGIVYIDINGLKAVNDQQGHSAGDHLLVQCAKGIREVFGESDLYRIGGDEFVVLYLQADRLDFDEKVARLRHQLGKDPACCAAIGESWAETAEEIPDKIAQADAAMYEDKQRFYRAKEKKEGMADQRDPAKTP